MQSCQQNIFMNSEKLMCYLLLFFLFFALLTCNSDCTFVFLLDSAVFNVQCKHCIHMTVCHGGLFQTQEMGTVSVL